MTRRVWIAQNPAGGCMVETCPDTCRQAVETDNRTILPYCDDHIGEALCRFQETVQRATLFDGIVDTHQTEAELNGHRASQGRML